VIGFSSLHRERGGAVRQLGTTSGAKSSRVAAVLLSPPPLDADCPGGGSSHEPRRSSPDPPGSPPPRQRDASSVAPSPDTRVVPGVRRGRGASSSDESKYSASCTGVMARSPRKLAKLTSLRCRTSIANF